MVKFIISFVCLSITFSICSSDAIAQEKVLLENGDSIVVFVNGTWSYCCDTDSSEAFHFRNANWGMTKEQVMESEKSKIIEDDEYSLTYKGNMGTYFCNIQYFFAHGKLHRGRYRLVFEDCSMAKIQGTFADLYLGLIEKYGKDYTNTEELYDSSLSWDSLNANPDLYCATFMLGQGYIMVKWEFEDSSIILFQSGGGFMGNEGIGIDIDYQNTRRDLEDTVEHLKLLNDL